VVTDIVPAVEFFEAFVNKFTDKDFAYRTNKLKLFREDCSIQVMAKTAFDFNLDDSTRLENLFGPIGNIKKMWLFIYLSFHDQEMLMLELRHKQYAEDFNKLNEFQIQKGMLAKKDMAKIYRLFKFFCLKDRIFSSFIRRPRNLGPNSKEKGEEVLNTNAMEIESDLKLPKYTDTEVMMDDFSISLTEFMSRFEKFKVDEVSIEDAEDDICFNAKDVFDESRVVSLIGLKYTEDEGTIEWEKKEGVLYYRFTTAKEFSGTT